jgi:hypothetical protein
MFAYRAICQNGMALGSVMNNVKEVAFHVGEVKTMETLCAITDKFIDSVINSCSALQEYVNKAMSVPMLWENVGKILEKYVPSKKHRENILKNLGIDVVEVTNKETKVSTFSYFATEKTAELCKNKWDLYNAVTNYATHSDVAKWSETMLDNAAQKILVEAV